MQNIVDNIVCSDGKHYPVWPFRAIERDFSYFLFSSNTAIEISKFPPKEALMQARRILFPFDKIDYYHKSK